MSEKNEQINKNLWAGRFREPLADVALKFSASIELDKRLFREDITGSLAHVLMLAKVGVISQEEADAIAHGLREIKVEIESGEFLLDEQFEDVHLAIEQRLTQKIGAVGGKLHTGRSRNDQVALDVRLYVSDAISILSQKISRLQSVFVAKSEEYFGVILPGYTHIQRAQPILLSHHLLAYAAMLERDRERFADTLKRVKISPLGSAALAGSSFPLDRQFVAETLGFSGISGNSIDAVSDRDFVIEFVSACAITMMHLSRFSEEMVWWSSSEFNFVQISDAFTTGSSIMPQKKNPDMAELTRGKTGRVYGDLMNLLTIMKSLPLAYNRDMQEDKFPLFDAADTTEACLTICAEMLEQTTFNSARMSEVVRNDFLTATEIADYLARKGVPFRVAHEITGRIVAYCLGERKNLTDLDIDIMREFSHEFEQDIFAVLQPEKSVEMKKTAGSTAPNEVLKQMERWKKHLEE